MNHSPVGEYVTLQRDVDAILIPEGHQVFLQTGTDVRITQALGGSYTVEVQGNLVMISSEDADSLGYESKDLISPIIQDKNLSNEDKIWAVLKQCYDPEIPVNIVDLGLIYEVSCLQQDDGLHGYITMTLTAPACGMGPFIVEEIRRLASRIEVVESVNVEIVFDPPWGQDKMSEVAKLKLGLL
ncbi:MAG TPA: putative Fe-S cluster assembly protein SufT [Gammaproteobacteria bacterium]|nr:putative Fe-S cluster assembly protein SufT [Gammaproteobacteria bacterium]